jgi:peptide deformylase
MLPREAGLLRRRCVRVANWAEADQAIQDLWDTWGTVAAHGIAAPQIGVLRRLFVYRPHDDADEDAKERPIVIINPKVIKVSGEVDDYDGCLSLPGIYGHTRRAERIEISALVGPGETARLKFEGYTARIIQHEMDHLDGVLWIDRLDDEDLSGLYTIEEVPSDPDADPPVERSIRQVPLTPSEFEFVKSARRPLPGYALHW